MEAGPGRAGEVEGPVAISGCYHHPSPSLPFRGFAGNMRLSPFPRASRAARWDGASFLGSAGHLCCQDEALGQACCWIQQQLGLNYPPGGLSAESLTRNRWAYPSGHTQTRRGAERVMLAPLSYLHPNSLFSIPSAASLPIHSLCPSPLGSETLPDGTSKGSAFLL